MFLKSSAAIFFSIACLWGFDKDPPVIFQIRLLVQFCRAFTSIKYYACNICRHIWYINSPNYKWTAVHLQWNFREKALVLWKPSVVPLYKTTQTNFEVVDCDRALVFPLLWFPHSAKQSLLHRNTCFNIETRGPPSALNTPGVQHWFSSTKHYLLCGPFTKTFLFFDVWVEDTVAKLETAIF